LWHIVKKCHEKKNPGISQCARNVKFSLCIILLVRKIVKKIMAF
jgi:hypothetical protein